MNRNLRIRVLRIDKRRIVVKRFIAVFPFAMAAMLAVAETACAQETTPEMLAAASKEGKVVWYTSVDVKVAEVVAKAFRAQYPALEVDVTPAGAERALPRTRPQYSYALRNVSVG